MNQEILSIETAEKLAKYNKVMIQRKNLCQYLKNQIESNTEKIKLYKDKAKKEQLIVAQSRIAFAQELLHILGIKL